MKPVLLIGCGGHAKSVIDLIEAEGKWQIRGMVGVRGQVGSSVLGYKVIGTDDDLPKLRKDCQSAILAIGQIPSPEPRMRLAAQLEQLEMSFPVVISPNAIVSRYTRLGAGTVVGHGAVLNADAVVGTHCTINTRAVIEHDVKLGDHCHVSTGAVINGGVHVGSGSFIGSGAMLREGLQLPADTVISAGKRVMGWPHL